MTIGSKLVTILGLITITIIIARVWLISNSIQPATNTPTPLTQEQKIQITQTDIAAQPYVLGPTTAKVKILVFSDFMCLPCAKVIPSLEKLQSQHPDSLALIFYHFPLANRQPQAGMAAQAAEAAGLQGKYWEMHNLLFERQVTWAVAQDLPQTLLDYSTELGLDSAQFEIDFKSEAGKTKISQHVTLGQSLKIQTVPSFVVDDQIFKGYGPELEQVVQQALAKE